MISRFSLSLILIYSVIIWGLCLYFLNIELSWDYAKPFTVTLFVLTTSLAIFNKYLWRFEILKQFVKTPDIQGTWEVEIQSTYIDPKTKQKKQPVIGYASIHQTFSKLSIRLMTNSSSSRLLAKNIIIHPDNHIEIIGVYQSDPIIHQRGSTSEIHYGAFKLELSGNPPSLIEGHYWTDRQTNGSIKYIRKADELTDHYSDAKLLFERD